MPMEEKDRATDSYPAESYVRTPVVPPSYETFCFLDLPNSDSVQKISARIWPEQGNSIFCETVGKYSSSATNLASKIMKVILATLNLDLETFYRSDFENCKAHLRINGHSSDGKSIGEEALFSHTDRGCLTILLGDEKEGLEIRSKEGKWFSVKTVSDTLVVNVGDSLKVMPNYGRYRSSHHRVVCKGWTDQMSIALFYEFPNDKKIWTPAELVDEEINPRRYKSFTFSDFTHEIRHNMEVKDKLTALERFAGI
ncbi:hypothetical protein KI387_041881 [Taxus chinensis]|uniref:Isopenicillin N synthase-like Fe(2+) 2OG dioxygenase domain-containing protein n=1 Tax=Taxus chinensis TaxID=29808 RepID=A0AA38C541_TAXCH|nr:hypothetical protein KI387_041881 [Taxus chinensis]